MYCIDGYNLLKEEFPIKERALFVPTVKKAYSLVGELVKQNEFLSWEVGLDILPHLRNVAVEFEFKRLIDTGVLNLQYNIKLNHGYNCYHIEIATKNCIMTISQVKTRRSVPRPAIYRDKLSLNNQLSLFPELDKVHGNKYYVILTHGGQNNKNIHVPSFIYLGLPHPNVKGWLDIIDLTAEPYIVNPEAEVVISEDLVLEFRDYAEQQGVSLK